MSLVNLDAPQANATAAEHDTDVYLYGKRVIRFEGFTIIQEEVVPDGGGRTREHNFEIVNTGVNLALQSVLNKQPLAAICQQGSQNYYVANLTLAILHKYGFTDYDQLRRWQAESDIEAFAALVLNMGEVSAFADVAQVVNWYTAAWYGAPVDAVLKDMQADQDNETDEPPYFFGNQLTIKARALHQNWKAAGIKHLPSAEVIEEQLQKGNQLINIMNGNLL